MTQHTKDKTLVFDWGDTLMRVFPQYSGVMAEWPEVAAVEGADEALRMLSSRYRLVVGTNAADSGSAQVRAALKRVGLAKYIDQIYTYGELGARKPSLAFFNALRACLDLDEDHVVMVGDDFRQDVIGARLAGWKAVWFNPSCRPCASLLPLHQAEISRLPELLAALTELDLPDVTTCYAWLVEQNCTANLLQHVQGVAAAAYQMALWLRKAGESVNPVLAHRGGLLHDLAKLTARKPGSPPGHHGEAAAAILNQRGYPDLGEIARRHLVFCLMDDTSRPLTWEQKIVYLADKLVEGGRIVSLEERMNGFKEHYPQDGDRIHVCEPVIYKLEAEICAAMHLPAGSLPAELQRSMREN